MSDLKLVRLSFFIFEKYLAQRRKCGRFDKQFMFVTFVYIRPAEVEQLIEHLSTHNEREKMVKSSKT
jgi:hypothetical protein